VPALPCEADAVGDPAHKFHAEPVQEMWEGFSSAAEAEYVIELEERGNPAFTKTSKAALCRETCYPRGL